MTWDSICNACDVYYIYIDKQIYCLNPSLSLALLDFGGGLGWLSAGAGSHDNCTLVARQLTNKTQYLALVCVALLSLHWSLPEATLWRRRRAKQGASTSRKAASSEPPLLTLIADA